MKNKLIQEIKNAMGGIINEMQMEILDKTLLKCLNDIEISETKSEKDYRDSDNARLLMLFVSSKRVEGCSGKTLKYYSATIDTTLHYAMVNQNNVKIAHRKFIG
jgi:hypothetical protein